MTGAAQRWFSPNEDKAWGEKFFLTFIPVFFLYNAAIQGMGWLDGRALDAERSFRDLLRWMFEAGVLGAEHVGRIADEVGAVQEDR